MLSRNLDESFFKGEATIKINLTANPGMYAFLDKMHIPQIDIDANPGALTVLQFLHTLRSFKPQDESSARTVATHAFVGTTGQA